MFLMTALMMHALNSHRILQCALAALVRQRSSEGARLIVQVCAPETGRHLGCGSEPRSESCRGKECSEMRRTARCTTLQRSFRRKLLRLRSQMGSLLPVLSLSLYIAYAILALLGRHGETAPASDSVLQQSSPVNLRCTEPIVTEERAVWTTARLGQICLLMPTCALEGAADNVIAC